MELTIPVEGGTLWADDSGGELPPLVLLHPGVGNSTIWDGMLPALAARYRVIRFDWRGYGRSPLPTAPYTTLGDLTAVLDHFGLDRVPLVGASMGGRAALSLALTQPARVSALVLVTPGVSGYDWPDEPAADAEYEALVAAGDVDGLTGFGLRRWGAAGHDPVARAQMAGAARAWAAEDEFGRPDPPVYDRLGEVAVPTVLLLGEADTPTLVEANERMAARIPGCRLIRMPGVDHLPQLRVPDLLVATILEHLDGTGRES
ncbi:MAG: alpha/beta fold hydrolase [Mycobacteriales bacterium]